MRKTLVSIWLVLGAVGASPVLAQTAGVVQFVAGDVKVVSKAGAEREARKGVPVNVGDTLLTPAGALAQLKMADGAIVVVQPESRLTVADFHYDGVEDGTEKVLYRLDHGGFRAITGAIGHTHKKNYVIETPIAHMGVRGTDHETYYFPATGLANPDGAKPGAYNKVNTGKTFIRTDRGEVEVEPNQVGFVASAGDVPTILPGVPGFFNRSIAPRSARPSVNPAPDGARVAASKVPQDVEASDGQSLVKPRGKPIAQGEGNGVLSGFSIKGGMGVNAATFGRSGNGMMIKAGGAEFERVDGAKLSDGNTVDWGTWRGGSPSVNGQVVAGGVNAISSTGPTTNLAALSPTVVTATYDKIVGTPAVTNSLGQTGTIDGLKVNVNFSTQQITNYSLQASAVGKWDVNGAGSIAAFTGTSGIALNGTCSGCLGGSMGTASGTANGAFVGPQAEGLMTSFGLTSAGKSISGAAYLTPTP
jgi:FecR protein